MCGPAKAPPGQNGRAVYQYDGEPPYSSLGSQTLPQRSRQNIPSLRSLILFKFKTLTFLAKPVFDGV